MSMPHMSMRLTISLDGWVDETCTVRLCTCFILDVGAAPTRPQKRAALELDALNVLARQADGLELFVIKATVPIPGGTHDVLDTHM